MQARRHRCARRIDRNTGRTAGFVASIDAGQGAVFHLLRFPVIAAAVLWACLTALPAWAQTPIVLVSNTAQTTDAPLNRDALTAQESYVLAISFVTGPSDAAWLLTEVDLGIEQWPAGIVPTVYIYEADFRGIPMTSLATLANPTRGTGTLTFKAETPVVLQPDADYSVVVKSTATTADEAFVLRGTYSDSEDGSGQTGWSIETITHLSDNEAIWDGEGANTAASQLAVKFTARGYDGESGPGPTGTIRQCGARLGSLDRNRREVALDICWERPVEVPADSVVIEERARYSWDSSDERFSPWKEVGRGDSYTSCTGGTACIQFTKGGLFRGTAFTAEMRMRLGNAVVAVSPQLKAQAPNGNSSVLEATLSKAVHEEDWHAIEEVTGPFAMELYFTDPNVRAVATEAVQDLDPTDFDVTNGTVTAVEVWNGGTYKVRATPATLGMPVTIRLRANTVKGVGEGLTDEGGNNYTRDNTASNLVVQPSKAPAGDGLRSLRGGLMAAWESVPEAHTGKGTFTVRLRFTEPIATSYVALRNRAIQVTGGTVRKAWRVKGRRDLWSVRVAPSSHEPVTLVLPRRTNCRAAGAVCTAGGTPLSYGIARIVPGPASFSVADAEVREATGATLDFKVTLSRTLDRDVTVDYATSDGTATAGADYTHVSDTLTFAAGATEMTVAVPVLNDSHDEKFETLTLTLSNPSPGTRIEDGEATGAIRNTDLMPQAWLSRFGRTVADQAIDAVEGRLRASRLPGVRATVAGQRLISAAPREAGLGPRTDRIGASAHDKDASRHSSRALTERTFLTGLSFAVTGGGADGGAGALWGQGAVSRIRGREGDLHLDGEVATGFLGADWTFGQALAGIAVAHSRGKGDYRAPDGDGEVSSVLTGVYPYGSYELSERLSVWGIAGYGSGRLTLTPKAAAPIGADMDLAMGALGLRGTVVAAPEEGGPELAMTTDAMAVRTSTGAGRGPGGRLAAAEADATRLRLGLEGSWRGARAGDPVPTLEIGVRHDGGDAETGLGLDLGGGLAWSHPESGLSAEVKGRGLLTGDSRGFRDRGLSASLAWDPAPDSDRGPSLALDRTVGASATGGMDALLRRETLAGLTTQGGREDFSNGTFGLRLTYGFGVAEGCCTLTPELRLGFASNRQDFSLGARLDLVRNGPTAFALQVQTTRREHANDNTGPEHGIGLTLSARW